MCSQCMNYCSFWSRFHLSAVQASFFAFKKKTVFVSCFSGCICQQEPQNTSHRFCLVRSIHKSTKLNEDQMNITPTFKNMQVASWLQLTNVAWLIFKVVLLGPAGFSRKLNIKSLRILLSQHLYFLILLWLVASEIFQMQAVGWMGLHPISSGIMRACCHFVQFDNLKCQCQDLSLLQFPSIHT